MFSLVPTSGLNSPDGTPIRLMGPAHALYKGDAKGCGSSVSLYSALRASINA